MVAEDCNLEYEDFDDDSEGDDLESDRLWLCHDEEELLDIGMIYGCLKIDFDTCSRKKLIEKLEK